MIILPTQHNEKQDVCILIPDQTNIKGQSDENELG
jgi:hypothetical protein